MGCLLRKWFFFWYYRFSNRFSNPAFIEGVVEVTVVIANLHDFIAFIVSFSRGHVWMWEWDYKESWALKNWCFWTVVLENTLKGPLNCKEIQPVHPKGDQSWVFIGRTDVEGETPILWPPYVKSWLIWKDPDAGKDWGQEEKVMTED